MRSIRILHFNDVYHIKERAKEPLAGAARFKTALEQYAHFDNKKCLTVCSGDCFAPSLESTISRGKHWPPIYNLFGIDVACIGNHDFDFGTAQLVKLTQACTFPWLLSNVIDNELSTNENSDDNDNFVPVAQAHQFHIVERDNLKIGFIGLAEQEWLETIQDLPSYFTFLDFVETAKRLVRKLKGGEMQCDLVIALTHMRMPNDELLASQVPEIDLILGGHDHFYRVWPKSAGDDSGSGGLVRVIKSGCDFMDFTCIDLEVYDRSYMEEKSWMFHDRIHSIKTERVSVTQRFQPDPEVSQMVDEIWQELSKKTSKVLCKSTTSIDARSTTSRTRETNLGSFTADIMRIAYDCDVAMLVGGTIRADRVYEAGELTMGDLMDIFPYEDPVVVVKISGLLLLECLENAVSALPKHEGRFAQVSGIHFTYDSSRPPMKRVLSVLILKHGRSSVTNNVADDYEPLEMKREYTMATRAYILAGNDGYDMLASNTQEVKVIVDKEVGLMPSILLRRFFHGLASVKIMMASNEMQDSENAEAREKYRGLLRKAMHRARDEKMQIMSPAGRRKAQEHEDAQKFIPEIAPIATGRIIDVNSASLNDD